MLISNTTIESFDSAAKRGKAGRGPCQEVRLSYSNAEPMHPVEYGLPAAKWVVKRKKGETRRGDVVSL